MTRPPSIVETVMGSPWVRDPLKRRVGLAIGVLLLAVLSVWPRHYAARAQMLPDDSGSIISSLLGTASGGAGGLLSLGGLIGTHQSIESDLTIARSEAVLDDVIRRLRLERRLPPGDLARAEVKLGHKAEMEAVRGSILRISVVDSDPAFAKAVVTDFVAAIRARLAAINLEQTAQKKAIAADRLSAATLDLARAQEALDRFRAANKVAAPEIQLGAAVALVTQLQATLQAEQAHLEMLQHFATDNNVEVEASRAQVAALKSQIADAQANAKGEGVPSIGAMTPSISEYENLFRNQQLAEAEYEIFTRYLGTVTVEGLSAGINMDLIEPPYVDPNRQYNAVAIGALFLLILAGGLAEFYISQTRAGPRRTA